MGDDGKGNAHLNEGFTDFNSMNKRLSNKRIIHSHTTRQYPQHFSFPNMVQLLLPVF